MYSDTLYQSGNDYIANSQWIPDQPVCCIKAVTTTKNGEQKINKEKNKFRKMQEKRKKEKNKEKDNKI